MASLATRLLQWAFVSLLWIGFCCLAGVNADGEIRNIFGELPHKQREFDYFMLSLQWPGTACRATRHCCSSNACCRGFSDTPTDFTIHGLWPDYNDGTWPACCSGKRFDLEEILTLREDLHKYWPSLSCDSPSNCHGGKGLFWEHEWEKHGPSSFPVIVDEYDYFMKALNLYFNHNVTEVLSQAGYVGSNSEKYPLEGIISAIQNAFHATPELECSGDAVEELRLCFYKDFKPRNCRVDTNTGHGITDLDTCPKYISLPELENNEEWEPHSQI